MICRLRDARIAGAIVDIPAKKLPGKAGTFKLVQGGGLGCCPPIWSGWHFISPLSRRPMDMGVDLNLGDNLHREVGFTEIRFSGFPAMSKMDAAVDDSHAPSSSARGRYFRCCFKGL
jgi:hypothetical protein